MTTRVLVTGFEPFAGRTVNQSWELVARLPEAAWLERRRLPVSFAAAASLATDADVLVLFGEAENTRELAVESVALNVGHARLADNEGSQPTSAALVPGAPLALPARWDAAAVTAALAARTPARQSFHAGTFVCNAALFHALHTLPARTIGFVHVPVDPAALGSHTVDAVWQLLLTMR